MLAFCKPTAEMKWSGFRPRIIRSNLRTTPFKAIKKLAPNQKKRIAGSRRTIRIPIIITNVSAGTRLSSDFSFLIRQYLPNCRKLFLRLFTKINIPTPTRQAFSARRKRLNFSNARFNSCSLGFWTTLPKVSVNTICVFDLCEKIKQ